MTRHDSAAGRASMADVLAPCAPTPVAGSVAKRAFDLAFATLALLLFLPVLALAALAIWLETGGPILFRQPRGGLSGRPFDVLKFRTMHVAETGPAIRQVRAGDVRVSRVGRVLRRFSIDELPQLINVLRGEMSLVGPRPHALSHDAQWSAISLSYAGRFRARPGLTGLAQVRGCRGVIEHPRQLIARIDADNEYIERWSLALDLRLIALTIPLMFNDPAAV